MKIIIARYTENVEWSKQFENVIICNKGEKLEDGYNEIIYPDNVGRESHTYYKYICDNYDNLDDYLIFLQGNPFDHSPNVINKLNYYINAHKNTNLNLNFEFISETLIQSNLTGGPCDYHGLPLLDVYEELFGERKTNMPFVFGAGAQFIVSREAILKRPKSFYEKIVKMNGYHINPIECYVIERFHPLFFQ